MDHLCYKCQASIDESLPFCPHCGAPQIRVTAPDEGVAPSADSPAAHVLPPAWTISAPGYRPQAIQWELAWKGAFLSGLAAAVLSAAPVLGLGCCLWLLGAGALAVWLYQRRIPGAVVTPGMGMRIGAVSGVIGFVLTALWSVFRFARDSGEARTAMAQQMEKSIAAQPDPRAQELLRQFMNTLNTPGGLAGFFVLVMAITAIFFVLFSAAGGALGASMFARRRDLR